MPKFSNLTRGQVMQIYSYIRSGARDALGKPTLGNAVPGHRH